MMQRCLCSNKMSYYNTPLNDLYVQFSTSDKGISSEEAARRLQRYGYNELQEKKGDQWWKLLLNQFNSPVIWILIGAVVVSLFIGESVDAVVIAVILVLNAVLGFVQEFKAEKAIEALKRMAGLKAVVVRDGKQLKIDARDVVPGDIIVLETGESACRFPPY